MAVRIDDHVVAQVEPDIAADAPAARYHEIEIIGLADLEDPGQAETVTEGRSQAVHYSIGVAPAIGYALLRDKLPGSGVARGALYGAGLFLMQDEVLNTVTGLGAKPQRYPWQAHARGIVAHTVYGVATELVLNLLDNAVRKRASAGA
jgi:uncharacterized membrane protein YagU involved in acid resistance